MTKAANTLPAAKSCGLVLSTRGKGEWVGDERSGLIATFGFSTPDRSGLGV
jgi:hypothetical protein